MHGGVSPKLGSLDYVSRGLVFMATHWLMVRLVHYVSFFDWSTYFEFNMMKNHYMSRQKLLG